MRNTTAIVSIIILLIIALVWVLFNLNDSSKKKYNWNKTFREGIEQPFNFGLIKDVLAHGSGTFKVVNTDLITTIDKLKSIDSSSYFFIGKSYYLTREEIDTLLNFAESGHQVMIIAEAFPDTLLRAISYFTNEIEVNRFFEKTIHLESSYYQSIFESFDLTFSKNKEVPLIDWMYFSEKQILNNFQGTTPQRYLKLSTIDGQPNHIQFKIGKGQINLHSNPILFTNYVLLKDTGFLYASETFSHLNKKHLVYDVISRTEKEDSESVIEQTESPLSYILKQRSLRWAWYIFLITVLLFFMFRIKRMQRIIPVLEQKRNTSLSFVDTLGGLYFSSANHSGMAENKMNLFLFFIRNKLRVPTNHIQKSVYQLISTRSNVDVTIIEQIFDYYKTMDIQSQTVSADELIELHNRISLFYKQYHNNKNK